MVVSDLRSQVSSSNCCSVVMYVVGCPSLHRTVGALGAQYRGTWTGHGSIADDRSTVNANRAQLAHHNRNDHNDNNTANVTTSRRTAVVQRLPPVNRLGTNQLLSMAYWYRWPGCSSTRRLIVSGRRAAGVAVSGGNWVDRRTNRPICPHANKPVGIQCDHRRRLKLSFCTIISAGYSTKILLFQKWNPWDTVTILRIWYKYYCCKR